MALTLRGQGCTHHDGDRDIGTHHRDVAWGPGPERPSELHAGLLGAVARVGQVKEEQRPAGQKARRGKLGMLEKLGRRGWRRDSGEASKGSRARPFTAPCTTVRVLVFTLRAKRKKGRGETRPMSYRRPICGRETRLGGRRKTDSSGVSRPREVSLCKGKPSWWLRRLLPTGQGS